MQFWIRYTCTSAETYFKIQCHALVNFIITGVVLSTSCSEAERGSNLAKCLEDIGEAGFNIGLFWFGTAYATNCPSGSTRIECFNPRPQSTSRSIFTRIFPTAFDPGTIDRYLKMVFTSQPGNQGCIVTTM